MAISPENTRLQVIVDAPLAQAVDVAARRCGLSVSELVAILIRDGRPATIVGRGDQGELRRMVSLKEMSPRQKRK